MPAQWSRLLSYELSFSVDGSTIAREMAKDPLEKPNPLTLGVRFVVGCGFGLALATLGALAGVGFVWWAVPLAGVGFVLTGLLDGSA